MAVYRSQHKSKLFDGSHILIVQTGNFSASWRRSVAGLADALQMHATCAENSLLCCDTTVTADRSTFRKFLHAHNVPRI